ncbi:MAG: hypothetical protein LBC02_09820, partial [Planctomycetaceae bacterium]|nr:hypothetical protein [Planctomycetaceae bacterium]
MTPEENFDNQIEAFQNEVRNELIARLESVHQYFDRSREENIEIDPIIAKRNISFLERYGKPSTTLDPEIIQEITDPNNIFRRDILDTYSKAIEGNIESIHKLGLYYFESNGTFEDDQFAFRLFKCAASRGYEQSFFMLGRFFYWGFGTQEDKEQVVFWFERGFFKQLDIYTSAF